MKKSLSLAAILFAMNLFCQTSWSEKDYSNETSPDEIQVTLVPLSISSNQELNQSDVSWRRGFWSFGLRYGIDNDRTNHYDINAGFYFYVNPYIDLTMSGGFGIRDPKIWVPKDYNKIILPVSFGLIVKPIRQVQLSFTAQKIIPDKTIYYQGGLIFLFKM